MRRIALAFFACLLQACGGSTLHSGDTTDGGPPPGDSGALDDGGSPCNTDQDCVGGSCVYLSGSCPGSCVPYRTQGEPCGSIIQGGDDGACTVNGVAVPCAQRPAGECAPDSGLVCEPIVQRCQPPAVPVIADAGQPCSIFGATCNAGLYCAGPFPDNGTCAPIAQVGGACSIQNPQGCADGLLCVGYDTAPGAGICQVPAPVGGSCLTPNGSARGSSGCQWPLQCVQGACVEPPASGPCVNGACKPHVSFCDDTGTCQPLRANGTPCSPPNSYPVQCASNWCDLTGHCGTTICPSVPGP